MLEKLEQMWAKNHMPHSILIQSSNYKGSTNTIKHFFSKISYSLDQDIHTESIVYVVQAERDKAFVTVNNIRAANLWLSKSSAHGKYKAIVVEEADKLSTEAANATLKTLEEPGENNYYFLITNTISQILKTIQSRCYSIEDIQLLDYEQSYTHFLSILKEKNIAHISKEVINPDFISYLTKLFGNWIKSYTGISQTLEEEKEIFKLMDLHSVQEALEKLQIIKTLHDGQKFFLNSEHLSALLLSHVFSK
ncbi:hypothetical protein [Candidatus Sneabacter namystus]|uniref:DNA polymerase III subunit delta n=1 Tax=Candidatus Sneabacter namystus TaxID=2601646 RepID=A0A5C0UI58_9RICK|nr:hypothetical protein [Candidatus Sneabacter namystus]QEK39449.1 hypothetical protein FZC37_00640 [Candidatus Sneabacter namystus]